jgi:hypothetical protein
MTELSELTKGLNGMLKNLHKTADELSNIKVKIPEVVDSKIAMMGGKKCMVKLYSDGKIICEFTGNDAKTAFSKIKNG